MKNCWHILAALTLWSSVNMGATEVTGTGISSAQLRADNSMASASPSTGQTPNVRVATDASVYGESDTQNRGVLDVYLSEAFTETVYVALTSTLSGNAQSNLVLSTQTASIWATTNRTLTSIQLNFPDGTFDSATQGIVITPSATNESAKTYYTELLPAVVYVTNIPPVIVTPPARDVSLTPLPQYTNIPSCQPFRFNYAVTDVRFDAPTMRLRWRFGDGSDEVVVTNSGLSGATPHTYSTVGKYSVSVQAEDKDGGQSAVVEFPVYVAPPPTVSVLPGRDAVTPQLETDSADKALTVRLSVAFTNAVRVNLTVSPPTNAVNGTIELAATQIVFSVGETLKTVSYRVKDGTDRSRDNMFQILPQVVSNDAATAYYTNSNPGYVQVCNVAPFILSPQGTDITKNESLCTTPQYFRYVFYWYVADVAADSSPISVDGTAPLTITWSFGDGQTTTCFGAHGVVTNTYTSSGYKVATCSATDKDGASSSVQFGVYVYPLQPPVRIYPVGPSSGTNYWNAAGLGNGSVSSLSNCFQASAADHVYLFYFPTGQTATSFVALPEKAGTNIVYDSFFYTWDGHDQGLPPQNLSPLTASSTTTVSLVQSERNIRAIFSREWRTTDNMGDINQDGIPDKLAMLYDLPNAYATSMNIVTNIPIDLLDVSRYNGDADYLPVNPSGQGGVFDFRPIPSSITGPDGQATNIFPALLELRGYHPGLNRQSDGSTYDSPSDEPKTSPILSDTDGDDMPDGWEFYFWYRSIFNSVTGKSYNPNNRNAPGTIISKTIAANFGPYEYANPEYPTTSVDIDNDGLLNTEEMVLGTNPIHWDTDGDSLCDGWEILNGGNPCVADAQTQATPIPIPFAWLNQYATIATCANGDYEAAATNDMDGDGFLTWQEYVAGSDPTNAESHLRTHITFTNGSARLSWTPDLGKDRAYTLEGCSGILSRVWGETNAETHFFRIKVSMP